MTLADHTSRWVWLPRPQPQARLRLICLPFAGGGASVFRTWPSHLGHEIEVCAIQLPGREARLRDRPITSLPRLVGTLAAQLQPYLSRPFAVFGHSLGALIAFELSRQLRRQGLPEPLRLFASACRAPHLPSDGPPIHDLPEAEFIARLQAFEGTPPGIFDHAELRALVLPVLRADFKLHETYTYMGEAPLACPISTFGGMQDPLVSSENLGAWRQETVGPFALHQLPGNHFFVRTAATQVCAMIVHDLGLGHY